MIILGIACGIFAMGFALILVKYILLKKDIFQIGSRLKVIADVDTNAQLCTSTFDKNISNLVEAINKSLEKGRKDFTRAKKLEADLKRAITNISHDLRTPLTSAKGYLQMIEKSDLDIKTRLRYLSIIEGRLDALTVLMDSLFDFSRALEGDLSFKKVNICNLLRDSLSENYLELSSKDFVVESEIPESPVYFNCDENAMKRVVQNLIKNACVHGKDYLSVKLSDGVLKIINNVDEINKLDTARIFDRFYTADAARSSKRTGLGLAIVKELLEKMGCEVKAETKNNLLSVVVYFNISTKK